MSFAKFSSDFLKDTFTLVDNLFLNEYLPYCDEKQIKVYLYGLYMCANQGVDNSLDALCARLDMSSLEILSAYEFFEDMGLVQIVSREPLEVKYLCMKKAMQTPKKYRSEKWNDFNAHLQQLFPERMLTPNEYNEYYNFIDDYKIDPNAMLMIVQYCIDLKGMSVRYPYILTVAKNWANDGVRTPKDVEDKLKEYDTQSEQMRMVLSALGRRGGAELDEKQSLLKWTRSWGYDINAIVYAASTLKGSKSFSKLDSKLDEYYRMSVFTENEMKEYLTRRQALYDIAISVNKNLGVHYESLEHIIEVYIAPWTAKGFDSDALKSIAHYCFITSVRTLEGMDKVVGKFYSQGFLTADSIAQYLDAQIMQDDKIKKIIEKSGSARGVNSSDRKFYKTWTEDWGFDEDVIMYAADQAVGKTYPTSYINQILSAYKAQGVSSLEQAKRTLVAPSSPRKSDFEERNYSAEELHSIVTSIDSLKDDDI